MSLVIYNTQSRKKETFVPHAPPQVKMYCCGPTVYDLLHVGNFRGAIFYNFVRNWLEYLGFNVTYVYNYTDVDDKIISRAQRDGMSSAEVATKYIAEFKTDFGRLNLRPQDLNPTVTESMPEIVQMIGELITKEKAYVAGGDVLFSIQAFPEYGKLSGRNTEDMLANASVDRGEGKRQPLDFALWKMAKPGEPAWTSPWGQGRPGWHIECSAMIRKHLGEQIDLHGGGLDLLFPHHENEIAQTEACTGTSMVKYWIHNNMINFGGAKMSKSVGNIKTGREFMNEHSPEIFKYMMMSVHYRSVLDLSEEAVENATKGLARIYSALALADTLVQSDTYEDVGFSKVTQEAWAAIEISINDDFNTPEAFARVFEVIRQFNAQVKRGQKANPIMGGKALSLIQFVKKFGAMMALFQERPEVYLHKLDDSLLERMKIKRADVDALVSERAQARLNKDFPKSDELRAQLTAMSISVSDLPEGSFWEVTK